MSSSFHKHLIAAALLLNAALPAAWSQQRYFVPQFEVMAEHDTNRELRPDSSATPPEDSNIYRATLEALLGQATPRSDIELHPRVVYQKYPKCDCVDPLEEFLNLKSQYRTQKGQYRLDGRFSRQDTLNAELGQATFDDDSDPTTPPVLVDTGVVFAGQTRTRYEIEPSFQYPLTQLYGINGLMRYQSVRYEEIPNSQRVGFKSPYAELVVSRTLGPLTQFEVGPYYSRFETDNNLRDTDSYGARIGLHRQWSERSRVDVVLRGERNKTTTFAPIRTETSVTNWGVEFVGLRENRVGSLRYSIGRFLQPSGLGNRRQSDQVQLQYDRPLSERLKFEGALRLTRDRSVDDTEQQNSRDRARLELSLSRVMTRTLELTAGYRYAWQDLGDTVDSGDNHAAFLTMTFRGLDPRHPVK